MEVLGQKWGRCGGPGADVVVLGQLGQWCDGGPGADVGQMWDRCGDPGADEEVLGRSGGVKVVLGQLGRWSGLVAAAWAAAGLSRLRQVDSSVAAAVCSGQLRLVLRELLRDGHEDLIDVHGGLG